MADGKIMSVENNLTKRDFIGVFWRSFTLLGSFNYERMEGLGFLFAINPILKKIYKDDPEKLKEAMHRHLKAFNMTVAPAPFVMGISIAMEEMSKKGEEFDVNSINAVKSALMGPLSGIGDTFFWGIFRIIACAIAVGFAQDGNPLAPFILLLLFNIPNFITRWFGLFIGYKNGSKILEDLENSGKMKLFTFCAGIVGVASIGCMIAFWVSITCPLQFNIAGSDIIIQDYLDQIMPCLLPVTATLIVYGCVKKKISVIKIIFGIVIIGFILGVLGILA